MKLLLALAVAVSAADPRLLAPVVAHSLLQREPETIVLDVRTPKEFATGRLPGARLFDYYGAEFSGRLAALERGKTYLVYCAVGGRSAKVVRQMKRLGFTRAYDLRGGIQAWRKADLSVVLPGGDAEGPEQGR